MQFWKSEVCVRIPFFFENRLRQDTHFTNYSPLNEMDEYDVGFSVALLDQLDDFTDYYVDEFEKVNKSHPLSLIGYDESDEE